MFLNKYLTIGGALYLESNILLGTSVRPSPTEDLTCFFSECTYFNPSLDSLQSHIQKKHNHNKKLVSEVLFFPPLPESSEEEIPKLDDLANLASGEESSSDVAGPSILGPIRGRGPHLQVRTTPYKRTGDSSSQSSSPSRRTSLGTLSPLLPLSHLSVQPVPVPSPLNQIAFSCPNSPTPPHSDNEMDVDDSELPADQPKLPLDEEEVLAKASFAIVPLPYLQTTPPTRLLICTKCQHGILPSSLISHSNGHNITLLPEDKKNLQMIVNNSTFLDDSEEVNTPIPPCAPIEGILVQNGFACTLCSFCSLAIRTVQNHYYAIHKDVLGPAKSHSKAVQVQALFAR